VAVVNVELVVVGLHHVITVITWLYAVAVVNVELVVVGLHHVITVIRWLYAVAVCWTLNSWWLACTTSSQS